MGAADEGTGVWIITFGSLVRSANRSQGAADASPLNRCAARMAVVRFARGAPEQGHTSHSLARTQQRCREAGISKAVSHCATLIMRAAQSLTLSPSGARAAVARACRAAWVVREGSMRRPPACTQGLAQLVQWLAPRLHGALQSLIPGVLPALGSTGPACSSEPSSSSMAQPATNQHPSLAWTAQHSAAVHLQCCYAASQ